MGYWNSRNAIASKAQYKLIIGERGNGKSYNMKDYVIKSFINYGKEFIYLRRYKEDIKNTSVESYFSDMNIEKLTNGMYQAIVAWGGRIYLSKLENGVLKRSKCIGYYMALSAWEHLKSSQYPKVETIVFEEFTASHKLGFNLTYLPNESEKLMQLVSTVFRDRIGAVYMIGNTVDRTCPYFFEWQLDFIPKMKDGESTEISIPISDTKVVSIYVEKTDNEKNNHSMIFGKVRNVIAGGKWEEDDYITIFPKGDIERIYKMYYYERLKFVIELCIDCDTGKLFNFIYPYTKEKFPKNSRIVQPAYMLLDTRGEITQNFNFTNKCEKNIYDNIKENYTVYASNACGTDFNSLFTI